MEILIDDITRFLAADSGYGDGSGDGYGRGSGFGSGYGDGSGDGYGRGSGSGFGSGYGDGSGDGDGYGFGSGYGSGSGSGSGYGSGFGYGRGSGYGDGSGDGDGYGDGSGIKSINGKTVYMVDGVPTIFDAVRGNVATGAILRNTLQISPCYIAKEGSTFAHGDTLHDAYDALMEKLYEDCPVEERIAGFNAEHPDYSRKYPAKDLFRWHHILTLSCKAGREAFCADHDIDIDRDEFTVHEFIEITKNAYGGEIIKRLRQ